MCQCFLNCDIHTTGETTSIILKYNLWYETSLTYNAIFKRATFVNKGGNDSSTAYFSDVAMADVVFSSDKDIFLLTCNTQNILDVAENHSTTPEEGSMMLYYIVGAILSVVLLAR
ncbi:unnamed protein product [Meganyctiphanes norvegica]|uniref:Uncharacterized protein n=1 Tax=Meganyctiphanes norvegica TaxID=48144 RepID=A0AAV2RDX7_MEGNR